MHVFRGFHHRGIAPACALTIGNFDGVHRGHQAMLALVHSEAQHRRLPVSVLTFEPHPRDYFACKAGRPELAPAPLVTLRDKLGCSTAAETGLIEGAYQPFEHGVMLYSRAGLGRGKSIYALYGDGTFQRFDDPNP